MICSLGVVVGMLNWMWQVYLDKADISCVIINLLSEWTFVKIQMHKTCCIKETASNIIDQNIKNTFV